MREILVSTHTRHRDVNNPLYMRDWTARDVKNVYPEGYYTKNKRGGAKRMGVILLIPDDIPLDFLHWTEQEYSRMEDEFERRTQHWRRAKYWIDLTKLVSDEKLRDLYDHDLLVDPIVVNKSYLDLFKSFEDRPTVLSLYDRQGSFTSGTVDIGPSGDPDANTVFEFESNIANLTGNLTGDVNEAFTETSDVTFAGWITDGHTLKVYTTGAGRHAGKYTETAHLMSSWKPLKCSDANIVNARFEGIVVKAGVSGGYGFSGRYGLRFEKCIIKSTHALGKGFYNFGSGATWNCVAWGVGGEDGFRECSSKNCTAYGYEYGFRNQIASNGVSRGTGQNFLVSGGDYNASDDDSAPGGNSINTSTYSDAQIWADAPNGDFSLVAGSPLIGQGYDYSGTFTDDINSVTRTTWDIGAWEYAAAGGDSYDASGSLTSSGALTRFARLYRALTGALPSAGALTRFARLNRTLPGSLGLSGAKTYHQPFTARDYASSLGLNGALTVHQPHSVRTLTGSLGLGGNISTGQFAYVIAAALGLSGALTYHRPHSARILPGSLGLSGTWAQRRLMEVAGGLDMSGGLDRYLKVYREIAAELGLEPELEAALESLYYGVTNP